MAVPSAGPGLSPGIPAPQDPAGAGGASVEYRHMLGEKQARGLREREEGDHKDSIDERLKRLNPLHSPLLGVLFRFVVPKAAGP